MTSTTLGTTAQHKKQKPPVHQCSILQQQQAAGQQAEARDPAAARGMSEHAEPARRQPAGLFSRAPASLKMTPAFLVELEPF